MSHRNSKSLELGDEPIIATAPLRSAERSRPGGLAADSAIDAVLCSVPLPEGLMTRLGLLAYTVPEDAPDQVDWLGC